MNSMPDISDKSTYRKASTVSELGCTIRKPITMGKLTKEELDAEIAKGMEDIENGRVHSAAVVAEEMRMIQLAEQRE